MGRVVKYTGLAVAAFCLGAPVLLAGCSAETQLTPKEAANVKGTGQMPPEARARIAEKMAESRNRIQQNAPNGGQQQPGHPGP